jgi:thiamine-monophosphate kinase
MPKLTEQEVIERLRGAFPDSGIGDDTAVLPPVSGGLLFTTDAIAEGVHFDRSLSTVSQAVQKLVTSNVSDIYAMGGLPHSMVVTAGLPDGCTIGEVDDIIDGLERGCAAYGLRLVGGDTVRNKGGLFLNASVLGTVEPGRAVSRSGAREGDMIVLFGACGASLAGMAQLRCFAGFDAGDAPFAFTEPAPEDLRAVKRILSGLHLASDEDQIAALCREAGLGGSLVPMFLLCKQHLVPRAVPMDRGLLDADPPAITAMIDISDGIAKDLVTLCRESGVGVVVDEESLPVPQGLPALRGGRSRPHTELLLSSGEEYVLLAAVAFDARDLLPQGAAIIGAVVPRADGHTIIREDGNKVPLPKVGFEHTF